MNSFSNRSSNGFWANFNNPGSIFALLSFLTLCLFIRFPFFFRDFIDHDESTFILLGQSFADGNLPYTTLWDLKPPFVFFYFAAIIKLFGKSLIAIRLSGVVVITLTSWFLYIIGKKIKSERFGYINGLLYIVFSSLLGTMQGVMSEHLAMIFCVWSIYVFIRDKQNTKDVFITALLAGVSLMFRLNLAYAYAIFFAFYLFSSRFSFSKFVGHGFLIFAGIIIAPLASFIPYLIEGIPHIWWNSVVTASLSYGNAPMDKVIEAGIILLVCILIISGGWIYKKRISFFKHDDKKVVYLRVITLGLILMLIKGGKVNGHYLLQLYPLMWFFILEVFSLINFKSLRKLKYIAYFLLVLLPAEAYIEYYKVGKKLTKDSKIYNGEVFQIVDYLNDNYPNEKSVFFIYFHLGYWLMDIDSPSKIGAHPSNICRSFLYEHVEGSKENPIEELKYLLDDKHPEIIVNRSFNLPFGGNESEANKLFRNRIENEYELVKEFGRAKIYKRLDK